MISIISYLFVFVSIIWLMSLLLVKSYIIHSNRAPQIDYKKLYNTKLSQRLGALYLYTREEWHPDNQPK